MATSQEAARMQDALKVTVIPLLRQAGFRGSYPHFRRITADKVDLVSFVSCGIFGGGYGVGASVIFPAERGSRSNRFYPDDDTPPARLKWAHGRKRASLPGMLGSSFYYTDVYARYLNPRAKTGATYFPCTAAMKAHEVDFTANGEELVQQADEGIYDRVAAETARQLPVLLAWFDSIATPGDLARCGQTVVLSVPAIGPGDQ